MREAEETQPVKSTQSSGVESEGIPVQGMGCSAPDDALQTQPIC